MNGFLASILDPVLGEGTAVSIQYTNLSGIPTFSEYDITNDAYDDYYRYLRLRTLLPPGTSAIDANDSGWLDHTERQRVGDLPR